MRGSGARRLIAAVLFTATLSVSTLSAAGTTGAVESPARLSDRTLVVGMAIDSGSAALVAYTVKNRPYFDREPDEELRPYLPGGVVQVELSLLGAGGETYTRRVDLPGLCFDHPAGEPPHVEGDTIRLHHDSFTVELPDLAGFDHLEVAFWRGGAQAPVRIVLGQVALAEAPFIATEDSDVNAPAAPLGTVHWPEEYGDPDRYKIWGSAAETERRINVVLVPDGYTHAQKTTLEQHAQSLVDFFRQKIPFSEHDPFMNYTLVYAYSNQDGTDQCDCSILRDTAMNTRFPDAGYPCGDGGNRCLYYGWGCDPKNYTDANIVAAELRAPAKDVTLVMVNTTRYGGCGGGRAVYAAGNSSATEIAVHELGHSLAGLADEYESYSGCGSSAGEINTSLNSADGAWPEWIPDIGAPRPGAEYYTQCVYRPESICDMRALGYAFCSVCRQRWSLITFGHWRVNPTAPVTSAAPASPVGTQVGKIVDFSVQTRLSTGSATNSITWQLQGPGFPTPTTVATGSPSYSRPFSPDGQYTLTCEVVADTNFVKPSKTGANRDLASWTVEATRIPEVSADAAHALTVAKKPNGKVDLQFEDVGASWYDVYVSNRPGTHPFAVAAPANGKKDCHVTGVTSAGNGMLKLTDYDLDAGITGPRSMLFVLVTADNGAGTETSLGQDSSDLERTADSFCFR